MARSLNRVQLIGNLTRDPELRYTPNGTAVCSFGLATNRNWTTDTGEKREEVEFHKIVSWNKLAELCSQFLVKGRKVYVEGRLSTRSWTAQDGAQRSATEIVIDDMILLDSKRPDGTQPRQAEDVEEKVVEKAPKENIDARGGKKQKSREDEKPASKQDQAEKPTNNEEVVPEDIPF